jgi:hypothetical protein
VSGCRGLQTAVRGVRAKGVASRPLLTSFVAGLILASAACDGVLGLNAPTLAPPADASAGEDVEVVEAAGPEAEGPEATADASDTGATTDAGAGVHDASADARADAAHDAGSDAPSMGIRCGGGSTPESWCNPSTQVCCQGGTVDAPTFACVAQGSCLGYNIACANYNDCNGNEVCCRFMAHQVCDTTCPSNEIVCDQSTQDACNSGQKCDVPFVGDAAAASPYLGCGP